MAAGDPCPSCGGVGGHRAFCGGSLFTSYRGPEQPSRRERIATAALQGMMIHSRAFTAPEKAACWAVEFADALIEKLDKEEE